jgi:hypothetical protein
MHVNAEPREQQAQHDAVLQVLEQALAAAHWSAGEVRQPHASASAAVSSSWRFSRFSVMFCHDQARHAREGASQGWRRRQTPADLGGIRDLMGLLLQRLGGFQGGRSLRLGGGIFCRRSAPVV